MPWYKSGTVSVAQNSNAVIGSSTAFIANARVGDAFRGPDGGWYEVTNIASDTALSISPDYQGVTNAAGIYALAPMQGYVKDSADALRALVNQYGSKLASLGTTGNYEILPVEKGGTGSAEPTSDFLDEGETNKFFTDARVRSVILAGMVTTDPSAVAPADSVLTAFGKLQAQATAALPKAGGTLTGPINDAPIQTIASAATVNLAVSTSNVVAVSGTTTIAALGVLPAGARRTIRFTGAMLLVHNASALILPTGGNITTAANDTAEFLSLGAGVWLCVRYNSVSGKPVAFAYDKTNIVGAVADGAIIESGTNASGSWVKYADGTMFCTNKFSTGFAINLSFGATFYGSGPSLSFPQTFFAAPVLSLQCSITGGGGWLGRGFSPTTTATGPYIIMSPISRASETVVVEYIAEGRWKA
jgi:hypothetical protein